MHSFFPFLCLPKKNAWSQVGSRFAQLCTVIGLKDLQYFLLHHVPAFSYPEAMLLLVSTKNHDLWECPTPEVHDSQTSCHSTHAHYSQSDKSDCLRKRTELSAHAQKIGPFQTSQFLVLTKMSAASGDENNTQLRRTRKAHYPANGTRESSSLYAPYTVIGFWYIDICSPKVCVFLAVSVGNGISILALVV